MSSITSTDVEDPVSSDRDADVDTKTFTPHGRDRRTTSFLDCYPNAYREQMIEIYRSKLAEFGAQHPEIHSTEVMAAFDSSYFGGWPKDTAIQDGQNLQKREEQIAFIVKNDLLGEKGARSFVTNMQFWSDFLKEKEKAMQESRYPWP